MVKHYSSSNYDGHLSDALRSLSNPSLVLGLFLAL
jgi:hypothetical protein